MLKTFLLICIILLPAVLLMGYRVFFTKKNKFPSLHVDSNEHLRKNGVHCAQSQDREARTRKTMIDK